jgi:hypothetical protein
MSMELKDFDVTKECSCRNMLYVFVRTNRLSAHMDSYSAAEPCHFFFCFVPLLLEGFDLPALIGAANTRAKIWSMFLS